MVYSFRHRICSALIALITAWSGSRVDWERERVVSLSALAQSTLAQSSQRISSVQTGTGIQLNGRTYPVAWQQWHEAGESRWAIADVGAMQILGLHFLDSTDFRQQPITWFSETPTILSAHLNPPYRYLDISPLAKTENWQISITGRTLQINTALAQLQDLRSANHPWGQRFVIELERPTPWQVSQNPTEGVVIIPGTSLSPQLQRRFVRQLKKSSTVVMFSDDSDYSAVNPPELLSWPFSFSPRLPFDQGLPLSSAPYSNSAKNSDKTLVQKRLVQIEPELKHIAQVTKLRIPLPSGHQLKTYGLPNPPRLVIDVRSDTLVARTIQWAPGLIWQQQYVSVPSTSGQSARFPVISLQVNLQDPGVKLQPLTTNSASMTGTAPLVTITRTEKAAGAINAGFFNRNNQLPLGAIRHQGRWLSGPILGRAVFAWDDQGPTLIDRLQWSELLTTNQGDRWPVPLLNTGYVQAGLARYTAEWGASYAPLTDGELIARVEQNRITAQVRSGKAGESPVAIPKQGFLLVARAQTISANRLSQGTMVALSPQFTPSDFSDFPNLIGAGPLLLKNRQIVLNAALENFSAGFQTQTAPRSAIARLESGEILLAAVHANQNGQGPTLTEWAQILQTIGAIDAMNLDGGSSTALALSGQLIDRSPVTAARVHNGLGILITPP